MEKLIIEADDDGCLLALVYSKVPQKWPLTVEVEYPDIGATAYLTKEKAEQLKNWLVEQLGSKE